MTREEAIRNINALNAICGQKDFYDKEFIEALDMAIKALSAEPCEDAVSRQAVLNEFNKCYNSREASKPIRGGRRMKFTTTRYIPIPDNATNGDIIEAMPNTTTWKDSDMYMGVDFSGATALFSLDWWNAPYKKGSEEP